MRVKILIIDIVNAKLGTKATESVLADDAAQLASYVTYYHLF